MPEIDAMYPDYSIYLDCNYALGFMTRGCPNSCSWCIVPEKEGKLHRDRYWRDIFRPECRKIIFLDNNALASNFAIEQLKDIIGYNSKLKRGQFVIIDFNQGLDARLIDLSMARLLSQLKWIRFIRLACDSQTMIKPVLKAISNIRSFMPGREVFIYFLIREDITEANTRLKAFDGIKGLTFFGQPYRDPHCFNTVSYEQKRFARYINVKGGELRNRIEFKNYL